MGVAQEIVNMITRKLNIIWNNVTIEPLAFITFLIVFLSDISTQELYIQKACQVNLQYSAEICANLSQHKEVQIETQEYVSGVQANNGFLQRLPSVVFTLFAGPLSDSFGRKPLLVFPIVGFIILNFVLLVNSIFFQALTVEFLLFECLQDFTGGRAIFTLAARCYIMDISSKESRTARLCILDAVTGLAVMIGSPLGTIIKNNFGYIVLYAITLILVTLTLIYTYFLKDSIHLVSEEKKSALLEEKEEADIKCDKGVCCKVLNTVLRAFKALFRRRQERMLIWCFMLINILATIGGELAGVLFLFYRLQYAIDTETFGWMMSAWAGGTFFSQLFIVPALSYRLGLSDTVLIIISLTSAIVDTFLETVMNQIWFLFVSWGVLQMLWSCMFTMALSAMSKLAEPNEVGKFLSLVSLANTIFSLGAAPAYNTIYRATVDVWPATAIYVGISVFFIDLGLAIYTHVASKRHYRIGWRAEQQEEKISRQGSTKSTNM